MITIRHLLRLLVSILRFGVTTRNVVVVFLVLGGLLLVMTATAAQTAAPFVLYPFA